MEHKVGRILTKIRLCNVSVMIMKHVPLCASMTFVVICFTRTFHARSY